MRYAISFLIVLFSLSVNAQVEKAKNDLPETKVNPNKTAVRKPLIVDRGKLNNYGKASDTNSKKEKRRRKRIIKTLKEKSL